MKKLHKIPTNDQLIKLVGFLNSEFNDIKKDHMSIVFELDKDLLKKVDEEYFFKNNKDANQNSFEPSDEVEIIISNVKIKFILKEDAEE